jgi:uncharacterized damage-inducible protein DinB
MRLGRYVGGAQTRSTHGDVDLRERKEIHMSTDPNAFSFTPGQPLGWDTERFMRGDEIDTAVITLERNRLTFAWKCADVSDEGLRLRLGASAMTLGGLLKHLAWVEEYYFQHRLANRPLMAPFDQLDLEGEWGDWPWRTAVGDSPEALRELWRDAVHRSRDALSHVLSQGGLEQTTPDGMNLRRLLVDMIEEYARHTGHADFLREQIDGVTGEGAPQDFPVP